MTLQPQHVITALLTYCFLQRHPKELPRASIHPAEEQQFYRGISQQPPTTNKADYLRPGGDIGKPADCLGLTIVIRDNTSQLELYPGFC